MAADAPPPPLALDHWRQLLGSQVFEALDAAVAIAALDDPAELRRRRNHIMELLFAPPAASPEGIATNGAARLVRAEEAVGIAKIRGVVAKKEDCAPAPTSKALVRSETAAAVAEAPKALIPPPRNSAASSSSSARAAVAAALSGPSLEAKLAATKRNLQEGYEEAADAKRQRRIKVIEAPKMENQRRKPVVRVCRKVCAASTGAGRRAMLATSLLGMCS